VGAQKAMKIASNFSPLRNKYSEVIIIETTTKSNRQFILPTLRINAFITPKSKYIYKNSGIALTKDTNFN